MSFDGILPIPSRPIAASDPRSDLSEIMVYCGGGS